MEVGRERRDCVWIQKKTLMESLTEMVGLEIAPKGLCSHC